MTRNEVVEERIGKLAGGFGGYVQVHDQRVAFTGEQLAAHRLTIGLRRKAGSVLAAVEDQEFVDSLRRTLRAWGIGVRASRLVPSADFAAALRSAQPTMTDLESLTIEDLDAASDVAERLWTLIESLGVVTNRAKLVAGTKTLHHLLPDLVVPMDREWTGRFFQLHLRDWQDPAAQRKAFVTTFSKFAEVARLVRPQRFATGDGWRTGPAKVLDNALIGFCKAELSGVPVSGDAPTEVTFDVPGYPPAKSEALSMLGDGHSHAPRVRILLEQAARACDEQGFQPVDSGRLALDVVVSAPPPGAPSDATNYLGGIADVLEHKAARGNLDHLGDLASIWLYRNDSQIKEVTYRELESDEAEYSVTLRSLS